MSDTNDITSGQGAGKPGGEPVIEQSAIPAGEETQSPGQQEVKSELITREEALRIAQEAAEIAYRKAQSYSDALRNNVQKKLAEVEKVIETAKRYGKELSADEADAMRAKAYQEAIQSPTSPEPPAGVEPLPASWEEAALRDPVNAQAYGIQKALGVFIEPDDPGADKLANITDPKIYLETILRLASEKAKASRTNKQSNNTNAESSDPTARIPSGNGSPGVPVAGSSVELWKQAYQKR
jgi:hypothetical protein